MSKKLFSKVFILLLVVGLLFGASQAVQAATPTVVSTEAELRAALADPSVSFIDLGASFTLAATVDVNRSVSIDGKYFIITGPPKGTEVYEGHGLDVTANDVSISNLTITGSGRSNLVFYNVTGGSVTNVTLSNAAHAGMIVNSSAVTISGVTTTNNTWGGINVDQGVGLTATPLLTVSTVTTHTSPTTGINAAIWVDTGNAAWVSAVGMYTVVPGTPLVFFDNAEFAEAFPVHNTTQNTYYATIQDAVTASTAGDVIEVIPGTYVIDSQITINKAITLQGQPGAKIQASGTGYRFLFTAGATLDGFEIEKTDKTGGQNIIGIQASNVTISDNVIHGQYAMGDPEVARAMEVSGGYSNISITGNTIYSLRQPAYINGIVTGIVQNNVVYNTRGWVVTGGNLTFTGNSWGDGSQPNAVDIAITNDHPDLIGGYYTDIAAMSAANNNAVIEDQRTTPRVLSFVYVDDNAASGGDGTQLKPYQTIQEGIARVVAGGTIHVAAGEYVEVGQIVIAKSMTITGADKANTIIKPAQNTGSTGDPRGWFLVNSGVEFNLSNVTLDGEGYLIHTAIRTHGSGLIDNNIIKNIYYTKYVGLGISVYEGTAEISNNTFTDIERVFVHIFGVNATATSVHHNVFTGAGNVDKVQYGVEIGGSATAVISGNSFTGFSGIASDGSESSGVLVTSYYGPNPSATVTNNTFSDSSYGIMGGYLETDSSAITATGNTFTNIPISVTLQNPAIMNLATTLTANTFPPYSAIVGNNIMIPLTKLNMSPATNVPTTDTCGQTFVDVMVTDVEDLVGYHLEVTFNPAMVTINSVTNGGFLDATEALYETSNTTGNATGRILWGMTQKGSGGNWNPKDGDGSLIRIYFTPKLAGDVVFTIDGANGLLVSDPDALPIPFEVTGGATFNFGSVVTNTTQTKSYCDLAVAVAQATGGDTLRVDANITSNVSIAIDKALVLDTNNLTISRTVVTTPNNSFDVVPGGDLTIKGGGTITATSGTAVRITGNASTLAKVTLVDATLYAPSFSVAILGNRTYDTHETAYLSQFVMTGGNTNETVILEGNGAEANITGGTLTGFAPIMGNGTVSAALNKNEGGTKITIGGTAVIDGRTGTPSIAIFHPQDGLLTINGGTIIGTNGIEMDAGDLVITGGTIQATGLCLETPVETPEDGSTNTGDAILILHQNNYTAGDQMHVTISGSPTIISNNCYALRELDFGGNTSELALATITGGHYTGGALGAVYFATNNATNLEIVGGDYSADPSAFVYTPYFTYLSGSRWYIAIPPSITGTAPDYYLVGEPGASTITITNPVGGAPYGNTIVFDMTIANAELTDITSAVCTYAGIPLNIKALLVDTGTDLEARLAGLDGFFEVTPGFNMTMNCSTTFATAKTYTFTSEMVHKVGTTEYTVATNTATALVYDRPILTISQDPYFIAGEAGEFSVRIQNPATGVPFGNSVVFYLKWAGLNASDITYPLDCYAGAQHWLYDEADFVDNTAGLEVRLDGLDSYFTIPAPLDASVTCAVTYNKTGAITFTDQMVHVTDKLAVPVTERPVSDLVSAIANAYTKPTILPAFPTTPINAGVPVIVPVVITNPEQLTDPFELVLTVPAGTVVKIGATTYPCTGTTCIIPVDLTGTDVYPATLNIEFTFPAAGTPDIGFALYDRAWMGTEDRLLATYTQADLPVGGGFTVTGNFSMQGNLSRAGVPVTFTWTGDLVSYGPTGYSTAVSGTNFSQVLTYGGSYTITTNQPRYLNVYEDGVVFFKTINLTGDRLLPELRLKGGNAVWLSGDNKIDGLDASQVGTDWTTLFPVQNLTINCGDVNFDGKVNIQDLALVGGNFDLTSAGAYGPWLQ